MKKIQLLLLLILMGISLTTFAAKVQIADARLIAKNTWYEQFSRHNAIRYSSIAISSEFTEKFNNLDVYYVFNINEKGFVIISADDICSPVIGYSFESSFSPSGQASEFVYWMNERKKEIAYDIEHNVPADAAVTAAWQRLSTTDAGQLVNSSDKSVTDVEPLITSLWDQGFPYNELTPYDAACSGNLVTGCVATALAQIMYYWRWPNTGVGNHCDVNTNYGSLCANFGATTYDWNGMVNQPTVESNPVALLMYHAGISVNMYYNDPSSPCESGAYTSSVATALRNYFRYATTCTYVQKSNYSTSGWNSLLQGDLTAGQPIQYGGHGPQGGHSWVCDGFQATDYYHFNWGWSGSSNGYYYLNNLNPGGYTFNSSQEAVVHIQPDPAQYPLFCAGNTNISLDDIGTIEDGSGPVADYQNNSNCSWLIAPDDSISSVQVTFIRFNTDPADILTFYDGSTTAAPVLGTFSGSSLPTQMVVSTGPTMLITFVSNGSTTGPGFLLNYTAVQTPFCNSSTTLTDPIGSFSDHSSRFQYRNLTSCKWYIQPENAVSITIHFSNFNTEATNDKVQVYNAVNPPVKLAEYSGDHTADPLGAVTVPSGKAMIMWTSNKTVRGEGWDANYDVVLGTNEHKAFEDLSVYPNPSEGLFSIRFTQKNAQAVKVNVLSLAGETVFEQSLPNFSGIYEKEIDLPALPKGIYILHLVSDQGTSNSKIVVK